MPATAAESRVHAALLSYFPMFIATLSLVTSIFNGYLNAKFVDIIQRNVSRTEYMRTCKEIIDAYFQVKLKIGAVAAAGERPGGAAAAQSEAENAVAKFAALGTYLANLRDEDTRVRYTSLSVELEKLSADARGLPTAELNKRYEKPDQAFSDMNADCIKTAKSLPL
jgi:hypothetical protein